MVRPLNPFDPVRSLLSGYLGASNRAFTLDTVGQSGRPLGRVLLEVAELATTLLGSSRRCFVDTGDKRNMSIVAARRRSGPKSWEITHLYVQGGERSNVCDLMDRVGVSCVSGGAERVFLRVGRDDPLLQECRRGGFFPCHDETLYIGRCSDDKEYASPGIRPRESADAYPLFQLHNASTPGEIRHVTGMTFDQWRASHQTYMGRAEQYVFERDGEIRAWMEARRKFNSGQIALLVHPGEEATIQFLVRFVLTRMRGVKEVGCLVPECDTGLKRALQHEGFQDGPEYTILVKSTATPVGREETKGSVPVASPMY